MDCVIDIQHSRSWRKLRYELAGVQHGFNNDTTPRYDQAAAERAWHRTVDFFSEHLRK